MLIRKSSRKREEMSGGAVVWDYPMPSKDVGIAVQELDGRVPREGQLRNKICHEVAYVLEGSGSIFVEGREFKVSEGDVVVIGAGKRSYVIARKLKLLTVTKPDWHSSQCEKTE